MKISDDDFHLTLTRPHNDFSLRNIFIGDDRNFTIIDWDATVHPKFPQIASFCHDLTLFIINIQSLLRFHPLVSHKKISVLNKSFISGYFKESFPYNSEKMNFIYYVFALTYYTGLIIDRPLYEIYRKRLS